MERLDCGPQSKYRPPIPDAMVDASAEEISNTSENNIFVRLSPNIEACTSKQYVPDCNLKLLSFLGRRRWWFATIPVYPTQSTLHRTSLDRKSTRLNYIY